MEFFSRFAGAGRRWRFAFPCDSPPQPARHFTRVSHQISPAISSLQIPPSISRHPDPLPRQHLSPPSLRSPDLPRHRSATATLQAVFKKTLLILARWLLHRILLPQLITDALADSVRFPIGGPRFALSQPGRRGMNRQSPIGFPQHAQIKGQVSYRPSPPYSCPFVPIRG